MPTAPSPLLRFASVSQQQQANSNGGSSSGAAASTGKEGDDDDVMIYGPRLAADIGGTLAKLVFFKHINVPPMPPYVESDTDALAHVPLPLKLDPKLSIESPELGGELRFLRIPSSDVPDFIDFIEKTKIHKSYGNSINITGGGAFKYEPIVRERLGMTVHKVDEMAMAIAGLNFLTHYAKREVFSYSFRTHEQTFHDASSLGGIYPYLLVNIGSGVSILRCTSRDHFERISGTSLGGGMFWGLCKLLTGVTSFEQVKQLSSIGDNSKVDLLVGDIYGTAYSKIGLPANVIASSFGKIASLDLEHKSFSDADIIRSLLFMTANNIAQIAYLNAQRYKVARVFFCGNFINRNPYIWDRLSYAMDFWSQQKMQALFLLHDGYLGALGAFLASSNFAWASPRATPPGSEDDDDDDDDDDRAPPAPAAPSSSSTTERVNAQT